MVRMQRTRCASLRPPRSRLPPRVVGHPRGLRDRLRFADPARGRQLASGAGTVSSTFHIQDAIIALPAGTVAEAGGLAYLQFTGINFCTQPESSHFGGSCGANDRTAAGSVPASPAPASAQLQPASSTAIPAATASGPGTRASPSCCAASSPRSSKATRCRWADVQEQRGVTGLLVPVQSATRVGKAFLPSAPPPPPHRPHRPRRHRSPSAPARRGVRAGKRAGIAPASAPASTRRVPHRPRSS